MINLSKLCLPDESTHGTHKQELERMIEGFFSGLSRDMLLVLYFTQKDSRLKKYFKEKIIEYYIKQLEGDNEPPYRNLTKFIQSSHLNASKDSEEEMALYAEAVQRFLEELPFDRLVEVYKAVLDDMEDSYPKFVTDAFADHLIVKATNDASLRTIQDACTSCDDYNDDRISQKIQKKLGIVLK